MLTMTAFEHDYPTLNAILARIGGWIRDRAIARDRVAQLKSFIGEPELARAARELGLSRQELDLAMALSPGFVTMLEHSVALPLNRRLAIQGIDRRRPADALLLQALAARCAACANHEPCESDLDQNPAGQGWVKYCPNATTIRGMLAA